MDDHGASMNVREAHPLDTLSWSLGVETMDAIDPNQTAEVLRWALLNSMLVIDGNHCPRCREVQVANLAALEATR